MRTVAHRLVALVAAVTVAACGADSPAEVGESADGDDDGALTACVAPTPRLVEETEDGWQGYDVEALEAVAAALELELRVEEATFDELVSGVAVNDDDRCDIAAGGIVEGGDLTSLVDVTVPYRDVDRVVVAPVDASPPPTSSARVGVEDGGPAADALDALDAGVVVPAPSRADLVRLLEAGDVDAVLVPAFEVPDVEDVVGPVALVERVATGDRTVMVLPRGTDDDIATMVDEALRDFAEGEAGAAAAERWLSR